MAKFSLDLPFFVPLADGAYNLNMDNHRFLISTKVRTQDTLDPRLGGIEGNFGFVRDQMGLLRFTTLEGTFTEKELKTLDHVLGGGRFLSRGVSNIEIQAQLVLMLFNHFLERYRVATRKLDIRSVGEWDLASMRVEDNNHSALIRLYGGGITLPIAGLSAEYQDRVKQSLAAPNRPSEYELNALQAAYALDNGTPSEAILLAAGALELATDVYLARLWRTSDPPEDVKKAAELINAVYGKSLRTIDDVLEKGAISNKLKCDPIAKLVEAANARESLENALYVRNLVAHSGVRVPTHQARQHVEAMTSFVLDQLAPAIHRAFP